MLLMQVNEFGCQGIVFSCYDNALQLSNRLSDSSNDTERRKTSVKRLSALPREFTSLCGKPCRHLAVILMWKKMFLCSVYANECNLLCGRPNRPYDGSCPSVYICPSVCLSVCSVRALTHCNTKTRKHEGVKKTDLVWTFRSAGVTVCQFSAEKVKNQAYRMWKTSTKGRIDISRKHGMRGDYTVYFCTFLSV